MEQSVRVGQNLEKIRNARDKTQAEVAEFLGMSRVTYAMIENGTRELTTSEAEKLCEFFSINLNDLLSGVADGAIASEKKLSQVYFYILTKFFPEGVYKTKLAKLLYLIDFTNFHDNLESMTGSTYIRRKYGPVAETFFILTDELYENGLIDIDTRPGNETQKISASSTYCEDFSLLTDQDKKLIAKICMYWRPKRTVEIVNFTHSQKPWQECRDGEKIPYSLIIQEDPDHVYAPLGR